MSLYLINIGTLALSVLLLGTYHAYLALRLRRNPLFTIQAVNREARTRWVAYIMQDESRGLLAVQTLRNSTMAATFLASTAVLLMIGTLNLMGQADMLASTWHVLNPTAASQHSGLWAAKILLLVTDFFAAFFSFAMAVRLFNHVGYHINLSSAQADAQQVAVVATYLNRAGGFYTLGMRAYYFAVPLIFWLFGPHLLLGATLALIIALFYLDRAPSHLDRSGPGL